MRTATDTTDLDPLPPLLTVREAAPIIGVSHTTAYEMDRRGELPTFGTGRRRVIKAELLRILGERPA